MIDQTLIQAQVTDPLVPLSPVEVLALQTLVRAYKPYREQGLYRWPNFDAKLAAQVAAPTVVTAGLRAVLLALREVPKILVESQGSDKQQSFYSTKLNWDELALDCLDIMFSVIETGPSNYNTVVVFPRIVVLNNRSLFCRPGQPFFQGD